MQAITTKVLPATTGRDTRLAATCATGRFVTPYDHTMSTDANHQAAASTLVRKLENAFGGWAGEWVSAQDMDGAHHWVNTTWTPASQRVLVGANPAK